MKEQATGNRQQAIGNSGSPLQLEELLRRAMPKVDIDAGPGHDLWPLLVARIRDGEASQLEPVGFRMPWYDWALAAGLLLFIAAAPVSIPVLLYYL